MSEKKRVFSGIQPTGGFTLGNYLGAIKNWKLLQEEYECIYCVVDLHSLTIRNDPAVLKSQIREAYAMLLAAGVDPKGSIVFAQSHVPEHSELSWLLSCYTQFGELSRMTQFKDKSKKHPDNINAGLFTYPVLMAADILLYDTDLVPIGADQRQHLELSRDIALRFNGIYGDTFVVPEGYFPKVAARVMSLQQPNEKMSKSDPNDNARIMMKDDSDAIIKKFKRAVTDSDNRIVCGEDKPGVTNLITIYSAVTGLSVSEVEALFEGKGYGAFKQAVGEAVADALVPIRSEFERILSDNDYIDAMMADGAQRASKIAGEVLERTQKKLGIR